MHVSPNSHIFTHRVDCAHIWVLYMYADVIFHACVQHTVARTHEITLVRGIRKL